MVKEYKVAAGTMLEGSEDWQSGPEGVVSFGAIIKPIR